MQVWLNSRFKGHYQVGTAAVVVAETVEDAADILNDSLEACGLPRPATADQFVRLKINKPLAVVLADGNY
jgi:hypothetical protein